MKKAAIPVLLLSLIFACCGDDKSPNNAPEDEEEVSSSSLSSSKSKSSTSSKKSSSSSNKNSSSSKTSSSSTKNSSSSKTYSTEYKIDPKTVTKGQFTDKRDGRVYKTVTIGDQTWMAENLNYKTSNGSECLDSTDTDCKKYGRAYTWATMMDTLANGCSLSAICDTLVQGICPDGWRIPETSDWETLFLSTGARKIYDNSLGAYLYSEAAKKLMAKDNCFDDSDLCGTDDYGFSAKTSFSFWASNNDRSYGKLLSFTAISSAGSKDYTRFKGERDFQDDPRTAPLRCIKGEVRSPWPNLNDPSSVKSNEERCKDSVWTPKVKPCLVGEKDNCEYGEVGNHKSVKIGNQEWVETTMPINEYTKYCPAGWHAPDSLEWEELFDNIGGKCFAGMMLKSRTGWAYRNGLNAYGLNIPKRMIKSIGEKTTMVHFEGYSDAVVSFDNKNYKDVSYMYDIYCVKSHSAPDISDSMFNPDIKYGEFTDSRDGKKYKTTIIGPQKWIAQNLNFKTDSSICYQDYQYSDYCSSFGRFYSFNEAQTVCPAGYHLPSKAELDTLLYFGAHYLSPKKLLSKYYRGDDIFGFAMALSGIARDDTSFSSLPDPQNYTQHREGKASFWSSDKTEEGTGYILFANQGSIARHDTLYIAESLLESKRPVRCVNDTAIIYSYAGEYGTLIDDRDNQEYKTVEINGTTWMAENLRYKTSDTTKSFCYRDSCAKYGRYYTYPFTTDSTEALCPTNWHVSTIEDWDKLIKFAGDSSAIDLKSVYGWEAYTSLNILYTTNHGMNKYGFSLIPNGCFTRKDSFNTILINQNKYLPMKSACLGVDNPKDSIMYFYFAGAGNPRAITKEISEYNSHITGIRCVKD